MNKKGIIQLVIEVDYDKMITKENIEALYGFTGAKDEDSIARVHMSQLGEKLNEVVKDLPHMRYSIKGDFTEISQQIQDEENIVEPVELHSDTQQEQSVEVEKDMDYVAVLDNAIEHVSLNLGMPKLIKINETMREGIEKQTGYLSKAETSNSVLQKYNGFSLIIEGMEELFLIEYKSYSENETLIYSASEVKE